MWVRDTVGDCLRETGVLPLHTAVLGLNKGRYQVLFVSQPDPLKSSYCDLLTRPVKTESYFCPRSLLFPLHRTRNAYGYCRMMHVCDVWRCYVFPVKNHDIVPHDFIPDCCYTAAVDLRPCSVFASIEQTGNLWQLLIKNKKNKTHLNHKINRWREEPHNNRQTLRTKL